MVKGTKASSKKNTVKKTKKSTKKGTNKNAENKLLFISVILVLLLIVIAVSFTYAYFSRSISTNGKNTETVVETGLLDIDFATSAYITNSNATLINDENAYKDADRTVFSVARSKLNTVEYVYYTLQLVDIDISSNLKSPYLKWSLYETTDITSETNPLSSGDFSELECFTDEEENEICTLNLYDTKIPLAKNVTDDFTLIIWLSNDENKNQTELLKGEISGKVQVSAVNS